MDSVATATAAMAVIRASRPSFRGTHDRAAFAVHAAFLAAGYSPVAVGPAAFADPPPEGQEEVGIDGWNQIDGEYGFLYIKKDKNTREKKILVKCIAVEDILLVDVLDLNANSKEPFNLQINVKDHVSDSENWQGNYAEAYKNFDGLISILNANFLTKISRDEFKPISIVESRSDVQSHEIPGSSSPETDLRIRDTENLGPESLVYPPILPGDFNDAFPGPAAGIYTNRHAGRSGGMLIGPNDPMFRPYRPASPESFIGAVPPGSRYDPIGPPGLPGFDPSAFTRRPRGPGSLHPDLQHFQGGPDFI